MKYLAGIIFTEIVGVISALCTRGAVQTYTTEIIKPLLSPPALVFPVAWTVLYALMGWGAAAVYSALHSTERTKGLYLFLFQLGFNFCWSFIFFTFRAFGVAFAWLVVLLVLVALMACEFRKVNRLAGVLQIPYLLWLVFAGYLNFSVWMMNPSP